MKRTNKKSTARTPPQVPSTHCTPGPVNAISNVPSQNATCPNQESETPNQKSDIINHKSPSPFQSLPEFASLPREQLDYIHEILRTKTYHEAQQEIWTSLGCRISTNRLQRYREKIDLAAALEIADEDTLPAVDQLNNILAGRQTSIPAAGILLIQQRALALAAAPKTSPTLLKDLFRIFTYEDRKNDNLHRRKITEQREATRRQTADDRRAMNEHKRAIDLRRIQATEQREKTRTATFEHQKQIDFHDARLAEQREQTRKQLADLAVRKYHDAAARNPKPFNQSQMTQDIEAIMAFGREFLRQERTRSADNPLCESQTAPPTSTSAEIRNHN